MRDDTLELLAVCLNHESHAVPVASVIDRTFGGYLFDPTRLEYRRKG
jgi:hypothetical protein